MKKSVFIIIGAMASTSVFAQDMAEVIRVSPKYVNRRVEICTTYQVVKESSNVNIIGAIAGGLLGNQIGGGNGQTAAAALGAVIGSQVGTNKGSRIVEEVRCEPHIEQIQQGEMVTFQYKGRIFTQHFD